jgi:hypothetical protein
MSHRTPDSPPEPLPGFRVALRHMVLAMVAAVAFLALALLVGRL